MTKMDQSSDTKDFRLPQDSRLRERIYYEYMKPVENDSKPDTRVLKIYSLLDAYGIHVDFYLPEVELLKNLRSVYKEDEKSIGYLAKTLEVGKALTASESTAMQDLILKYGVDHYSHFLMLKLSFDIVEGLLTEGHRELYKLDDFRKLLNQVPVSDIKLSADNYEDLNYDVLVKKTSTIESKFKLIVIYSQLAED